MENACDFAPGPLLLDPSLQFGHANKNLLNMLFIMNETKISDFLK